MKVRGDLLVGVGEGGVGRVREGKGAKVIRSNYIHV